MTSNVVLVRHGESEGNVQHVLCGWYDVDLTEKGKEQARNAGSVLKEAGFKFDIAYTSVLTRAQKTLQYILAEMRQTNVPIVPTWRLNERHYGGLTGLSKAELAEKYGEKQLELWHKGFDVPIPLMDSDHPNYEQIVKDSKYTDGPAEFPKFETFRSAVERTLFFWNSTVVPQIRAGKQIIIAGHENTLRGIIQYLSQMSDDQTTLLNLPNAVPFLYSFDKNLQPIRSLEFLVDSGTVEKAKKAVVAPKKTLC